MTVELIRADIHHVCDRHCVKLFFSIYDLLGSVRAARHTMKVCIIAVEVYGCLHTWFDCLVQTHGSVHICTTVHLISNNASENININWDELRFTEIM